MRRGGLALGVGVGVRYLVGELELHADEVDTARAEGESVERVLLAQRIGGAGLIDEGDGVLRVQADVFQDGEQLCRILLACGAPGVFPEERV